MSRRIPKLRLHKPSRQGVVTLSGKDIYLGSWPAGRKAVPDDVQAAYERAIAEWLAEGFGTIRESVPVPAAQSRGIVPITVAELAAQFWVFAEKKYRGPDGKPTAETSSHRVTLRVLRRLYGSILVADFGPLKLRAVREAFIAAGMARVNVNHHVGRVKRIFKWGVEREIVPPQVLLGLSAVGGLRRGGGECREGRIVRPVPDALIDCTLPCLPPPALAMVQLLRLTGMRVGEACAMRPADIDKTGTVWTYRPTHHKTASRGHVRVIAIGPKGQACLRPLLEGLSAEDFIFSPARWVAELNAAKSANRKTPLWPSHVARNANVRKKNPGRTPGDRYTPHSVARAVARACAKASPVPKDATPEEAAAWKAANWWHVHQLRHSFATAARKAVGIEAASASLGHSGLAVTEIYAERDQALAEKVATLLG